MSETETEWFEAPDPMVHPEAFIDAAVDYYGEDELIELSHDVAQHVAESTTGGEMGPGAAIAALRLAMRYIYEEETFA